MIVIGVDPGVHTGIAVWDTELSKLVRLVSTSIVPAFQIVFGEAKLRADRALVLVEDARMRKVFHMADQRSDKPGRREGVGSIKRDCSIWQEYLEHHEIAYLMRIPRHTKVSAKQFSMMSAWSARTNEHQRDAAMIVLGLNEPMARGLLSAYHQGRSRTPA